MTTRDPDDATLVAYAAGELDEAARLAFEQRLADEPTLAQRLLDFESLQLVGDVVRRAATHQLVNDGLSPATRRRSLRWPLTLLVVAAAAALTLWLLPADEAVACQVRIVASLGTDDTTTYARELGLPERFQNPLGEQRGSETPAQTVTIDEFLAETAAAEARRSEAAMAAPSTTAAGVSFFTLQLRPERECSAMVLQLDGDGFMRRTFPAPPGLAPFGELANRFAAGRVHVLPRPVALRNALGTLSLHPGFDIASELEPRRAWLLCGVRSEEVTQGMLMEFDALLPPTPAAPPGDDEAATTALAPLRTWLQQHGFAAQQLAVRGD